MMSRPLDFFSLCICLRGCGCERRVKMKRKEEGKWLTLTHTIKASEWLSLFHQPISLTNLSLLPRYVSLCWWCLASFESSFFARDPSSLSFFFLNCPLFTFSREWTPISPSLSVSSISLLSLLSPVVFVCLLSPLRLSHVVVWFLSDNHSLSSHACINRVTKEEGQVQFTFSPFQK